MQFMCNGIQLSQHKQLCLHIELFITIQPFVLKVVKSYKMDLVLLDVWGITISGMMIKLVGRAWNNHRSQ